MSDAELIKRCREIIECDTARISQPGTMMFLIIGFNRSTKDDAGQWSDGGEDIDFDYVAETTVASGNTNTELIASSEEYKRISGMSMKEFIITLL